MDSTVNLLESFKEISSQAFREINNQLSRNEPPSQVANEGDGACATR
jgi:hypothetical protein